MSWREIWYDKSGRVRSGWRAVIFLLLAQALGTILHGLLEVPLSALSLPVAKDPRFAALVLALSMIPAYYGVGAWAARTFEGLSPDTLGVAPRGNWLARLLAGLLAGLAVIVLFLLILQAVGVAEITWQAPSSRALAMLGGTIAVMLLAGVGFELMTHGYFFQTLLRGAGPLAALAITALVFTLPLEFKDIRLIGLANLFVWVVLFGMLYLRSGSLWLPIGLNAGWNAGLLAFGLPISGMGAVPSFCHVTLHGHPYLTGGSAGPESGALVAIAQLALVAVITYAPRGLSLESAWWQWRELLATPAAPPAWDFLVGNRAYQWRLPVPDDAE